MACVMMERKRRLAAVMADGKLCLLIDDDQLHELSSTHGWLTVMFIFLIDTVATSSAATVMEVAGPSWLSRRATDATHTPTT